MPMVVTLIPKALQPVGSAKLLNMKDNYIVLPSIELLVPQLVVWAVAPKLEVVALPKEKTAVVLPKAGWVLAGVPKAEAVSSKPPNLTVLPKAGWDEIGAGVAIGLGLQSFQK